MFYFLSYFYRQIFFSSFFGGLLQYISPFDILLGKTASTVSDERLVASKKHKRPDSLEDHAVDRPHPFDHIMTGIEKRSRTPAFPKEARPNNLKTQVHVGKKMI